MRRAPDASIHFSVAAAVLLWSHAFLWMKVAGAEMDAAFVAGARVMIGAATVIVIAAALRRSPPMRWPVVGWCGLISVLSVALPFALLAWAAQRLPSGVVGLFLAGIPLIVLPLAHALSPVLGLNERLSARKPVGILVGAAGVLAVFGPESFANLQSSDTLAQLACLAAAACYALGSISIRAMPQTEPIGASVAQLTFASLLLAPFAWSAAPTQEISVESWAALAALGVGATGLAMILRVYVISTAGPVFFSAAGYLVPLCALLAGWFWADERFETLDLIGAALILGGVAIAQGLVGGLARRIGARRW